MAPKSTMPTDPEALEEWRKDPRAYGAIERLQDAYEQLVEELHGRVNVTAWRLYVLRDDVRDALAEKERDVALESAGLKERDVAARRAGQRAESASSDRWLDAAWATWTAAIGDVDALLTERYAGDVDDQEGGE